MVHSTLTSVMLRYHPLHSCTWVLSPDVDCLMVSVAPRCISARFLPITESLGLAFAVNFSIKVHKHKQSSAFSMVQKNSHWIVLWVWIILWFCYWEYIFLEHSWNGFICFKLVATVLNLHLVPISVTDCLHSDEKPSQSQIFPTGWTRWLLPNSRFQQDYLWLTFYELVISSHI